MEVHRCYLGPLGTHIDTCGSMVTTALWRCRRKRRTVLRYDILQNQLVFCSIEACEFPNFRLLLVTQGRRCTIHAARPGEYRTTLKLAILEGNRGVWPLCGSSISSTFHKGAMRLTSLHHYEVFCRQAHNQSCQLSPKSLFLTIRSVYM